MEKATVAHRGDSDSGRSPSEDEKHLGTHKPADALALIPDPDEGLSAEERAQIVILALPREIGIR